MTNATIFNGGEDNNTSVQPASETADATLFTALVGENQKYKTPEDLAKAYANADSFIEKLKEENRKLREQAASAKTIEDVLERMSTQDRTPEKDNSPDAGYDPVDVQQLVEKTLVGREAAKRRDDNLAKADTLMKEKFGDKAIEVFKQRASSPEKAKILMELAATDPSEFVSLFATGTTSVSNSMDTSSVNTTSVPSTGGDRTGVKGTREWAAKVRKENPSLYWSQEFQYELQQTVSKNPSLYFGT